MQCWMVDKYIKTKKWRLQKESQCVCFSELKREKEAWLESLWGRSISAKYLIHSTDYKHLSKYTVSTWGEGTLCFFLLFFFLCVWMRRHKLEFTYHWRSKPFVLWLLLTMECMANYNSPSVGDCCKLRQDMKRLWGMAVLVMGRGQIEQRRGQHTFIISIVSLVQRQSKDLGSRLRGCYPPSQRNETNDSLYPWRWPGFSSLMLCRWSTFSIISFRYCWAELVSSWRRHWNCERFTGWSMLPKGEAAYKKC